MSEPMTREEAIEILSGKNTCTHYWEGRHYKDALLMAIAALRREDSSMKALEDLYNECVAAGFSEADDFGWPHAMQQARHVLLPPQEQKTDE